MKSVRRNNNMEHRKKLNIKGKYILIATLLLIGVIGITGYFNISESRGDSDSLIISKDGEDVKTFTLKEIREMPSATAHVKLISTEKGDEEGDFKGVDVKTLLQSVDPELLDECSKFIFVAGDGYSSALTAKEILKDKNVILAYEKDGENFTHFNEGGSGPLRVIITSDTYGNRSTKFVTRIECR